MIESTVRQALRNSVNDVLEKMFFVQPLGELAGQDSVGTEGITARLAFEGEPAGLLTMRLTSAAARQIAADFLGADEEGLSDVRVAEVVCELANMICGSVLSRVESATSFQLSAPHIVGPSDSPAAGRCATMYAVELSNGSLTVNLITGTAA